jgi:hypothetical protein
MNNKMPLAFAALLLAASPALRAQQSPADAKVNPPAPAAADTARYDQQLADVQANMKKMQEQMDKIRAAKDPAVRQKLMQEHMSTMQATMGLMHDMMSPGMLSCCQAGMGSGGHMMSGPMMGGSKMGQGGMMGGGGPPGSDPMQQRHRMMEQMVGMQQMMMQHMLDYQQMLPQMMQSPPAR